MTPINSAISTRLFPCSTRFLICWTFSGVNFVGLPRVVSCVVNLAVRVIFRPVFTQPTLPRKGVVDPTQFCIAPFINLQGYFPGGQVNNFGHNGIILDDDSEGGETGMATTAAPKTSPRSAKPRLEVRSIALANCTESENFSR